MIYTLGGESRNLARQKNGVAWCPFCDTSAQVTEIQKTPNVHGFLQCPKCQATIMQGQVEEGTPPDPPGAGDAPVGQPVVTKTPCPVCATLVNYDSVASVLNHERGKKHKSALEKAEAKQDPPAEADPPLEDAPAKGSDGS